MSLKFISIPTKTLDAQLNSDGYSFSLNNILGWDEEPLEAADFGTEAFGAFRSSDGKQIEFFKWDPSTIANSSITITLRGLSFNGDLSTEIAANKLDWVKNDTQVELGSNPAQIYQWLKEYADALAIAGASDASETVKGIVEIATDTEIENATSTGSTGAPLVMPADSAYVSGLLDRVKQKRTSIITTSSTPAINTDTTDVFIITAQATNISSFTTNLTGSPTLWQLLAIDITGTATRTITWGASFADGGVYSLPTTTVGTTPLKVLLQWNGTDWVCIGVA